MKKDPITIDELMVVRDKAFEALAEQKPGNEFIGAFGEAKHAGYKMYTIEHNVFCAIFVGAIDEVRIDGLGTIMAIKLK